MDYKTMLEYWPVPAFIIDEKGVILESAKSMEEIFGEEIKGKEATLLLDMKLKVICQGGIERPVRFSYKNSIYKIVSKPLAEENKGLTVVSFKDITKLENLKTLYNEAREALAIIQIDNYEDLIQGTSEENRGTLLANLEKAIRSFGNKMDGAVTRVGGNKFMVRFSQAHLEAIAEEKYSILDEIRGIETETDFPATLSIGVGAGGKTPAETEHYAQEMLDLALGRGGDQAVVKKVSKIEYYGGKSQTVEKTNKGKSRVVAHALTALINQSSRVFIMGHKNPDMDSFGAALGIFRMCDNNYNEAYIVLENENESLGDIAGLARGSGSYNFVTAKEALALADKDSLLILVDFHRGVLAESPELILSTEKIAIIDHHRRAEDIVENTVLQYIEPYASSASELVSEILSYSGERKNIDKLEAEMMLAGITMDTNRFSVKTGVRTFEAAAWLRKQGADTTEVKRFFQTDLKTFKTKAKCISKAQISPQGDAITICEGDHQNAQMVAAQIADELLAIKGIKASYVLARDKEGQTVISARSLGEVNVQLIMEKLGGGGHLTTAGCQSEEDADFLLKRLREILKENS